MTLDFELDYGGRSKTLQTLDQTDGHKKLKKMLDQLEVPLTAFVQTGVLERDSRSIAVLKFIADEFHSHSHSHATQNFNSRYEFETSLQILNRHFQQDSYGYRAPFGKLYAGDHEILHDMGFSFDASVFPSYRPGKFNNLNSPIHPHRLPCGLLEIPFGVMPHARLILGISYMKLFGPRIYQLLEKLVGLPRIVVCYAHMHDFFPTSATNHFSPAIKMAFSRNREHGISIAQNFLTHLKANGYQLLSMNQLAAKLKEEGV